MFIARLFDSSFQLPGLPRPTQDACVNLGGGRGPVRRSAASRYEVGDNAPDRMSDPSSPLMESPVTPVKNFQQNLTSVEEAARLTHPFMRITVGTESAATSLESEDRKEVFLRYQIDEDDGSASSSTASVLEGVWNELETWEVSSSPIRDIGASPPRCPIRRRIKSPITPGEGHDGKVYRDALVVTDDLKSSGTVECQIERRSGAEIVNAVWSLVAPIRPELDAQLLLQRLTSIAETNEEVLFYDTVETLLRMIKERETETATVMEELHQVRRPQCVLLVKREVLEQVEHWVTAARTLSGVASAVGVTSLKSQVQQTWDVELAQPILRVQILTAARLYVAALQQSLEILDNVQHALVRQKTIFECLKLLDPLAVILHEQGKNSNGQWIFEPATRHCLAHRLGFILSVLIPQSTRSLHLSLEELGWGAMDFGKGEASQDSRCVKTFKENVAALIACQQHYTLLEALASNDDPTERNHGAAIPHACPRDATMCWVSACLASLLWIRFKLYFASPDSPLCRLNDQQQPFAYLTALLKSHTDFLFSCYPHSHYSSSGTPSKTPSSWMERVRKTPTGDRLEDEVDVHGLVYGFVDLLSTELGRFVVERANLLSGGHYRIAVTLEPHAPSTQGKPLNLGVPGVSGFDIPLYDPPSEGTIEGLVVDMIDDTIRYSEGIATLCPWSVASIFHTPSRPALPSWSCFDSDFQIPFAPWGIDGKQSVPYHERRGDEAKEQLDRIRPCCDSDPMHSHQGIPSFKALFDDVGRQEGRRKQQRTSEKSHVPEQRAFRFKNCIDILSEFDAKRLLKALTSRLRVSSILKVATLTQSSFLLDAKFDYPHHAAGFSGRRYNISESLRYLIEVIQVCESRISILTPSDHPTHYGRRRDLGSEQEGDAEVEVDPASLCLKTYSAVVFKPLWNRMRIGLRDAWNSIEKIDTQIARYCLVLDSFQLGLDFLKSEGVFSGAPFLKEEAGEWERLAGLTFKSVADMLEESYRTEFRRYILSDHPKQFVEHVLARLLVASDAVSLDASRAELLNKIVDFAVEEIFKHLDLRINILSSDEREIFVAHCSYVKDLVRGFHHFVPSPEALTQLIQLDELLHLLTMATDELRPILQRLDLLMSQLRRMKEATPDTLAKSKKESSHGAHSFLGAQLVVEAENLLKSTRELLLPSSPVGFEPSPHPSTPSTERALKEKIQRLLQQELQVSELNAQACFGILRKRREFCFASGYQVLSTESA